MIIFMSQAPILFVALPLLVLIALFELIGLKMRRNIQVLSVVALACLLAAVPVSASNAGPAALLFATGVTLSIILALYSMATARRGKQWPWFMGLLLVAVAAVVSVIIVHVTVGAKAANLGAELIFVLTVLPGASALLYGIFAPDILKPRGSTWWGDSAAARSRSRHRSRR
jgi:hypothetical protein